MIWLNHSDSWSRLLSHLLSSEDIKLKLAEVAAIVDTIVLESCCYGNNIPEFYVIACRGLGTKSDHLKQKSKTKDNRKLSSNI